MTANQILIVCSGEHSKSQMLAGYLAFYSGSRLKFEVATTFKHVLHPLAIQVMKEDGIDISAAKTNKLSDITKRFDIVVNMLQEETELPDSVQADEVVAYIEPNTETVSAFEDVVQQFRDAREHIRLFAIELAGKYSPAHL